MAKEPWEEKIVKDSRESRTRHARSAFLSTPWLTALLSVFFVIIVAILFIFFYTSNSGGNKQNDTIGFYGASSSKASKKSDNKNKTTNTKDSSKATSNDEASGTSTDDSSSSSSSSAEGQTIVVQPGEGVASIAGRAGISVEELQVLNPDHMTQGYWYANPGDAVIIK